VLTRRAVGQAELEACVSRLHPESDAARERREAAEAAALQEQDSQDCSSRVIQRMWRGRMLRATLAPLRVEWRLLQACAPGLA
jgi:hypothetical protein